MAQDGKKHRPLSSFILLRFGAFVTGSTVVFALLILLLIFLSGSRTESITEDGLNNQLTQHIKAAAVEKSAKLTEQFVALESSVIGVSKGIYEQAVFEESIALNPPPTDYDSKSLPAGLLVSTDRRSAPVSLTNSVWYLPTESGSLTVTTTLLKEGTHFMDLGFFQDQWDMFPDVIAMYVGFEDDGLFRLYPGEDFNNGTYDPRVRDWYGQAMDSAADGQPVVTPPYLDAFGQGWLVSVAQRVGSASSSQRGVTSLDLKIGDLQQDVVSTTFLGLRAVQMATLDGVVVASVAWDSDTATDTSKIYDSSIQTASLDAGLPDFSREFFERMADTSSPAATTYSYTDSRGRDYSVARSFLPVYPTDVGDSDTSTWKPQFVILVSVPQATTDQIVSDMSDDISTSTTEFVLIAMGILLVTYVLVLLFLWLFVNSVVKPLHVVRDYADSISKEGGATSNMWSEDKAVARSNLEEIQIFLQEFQQLLHSLGKGTTKAKLLASATPNPFIGKPPSYLHTFLVSNGHRQASDRMPGQGRSFTITSQAGSSAGAGAGSGGGGGGGAGEAKSDARSPSQPSGREFKDDGPSERPVTIYSSRGNKTGVAISTHPDGAVDVRLEDGSVRQRVLPWKLSQTARRPPMINVWHPDAGEMQRGWSLSTNSDGTHNVAFITGLDNNTTECLTNVPPHHIVSTSSTLPVGAIVRAPYYKGHLIFAKGMVSRVDGGRYTVDFADASRGDIGRESLIVAELPNP